MSLNISGLVSASFRRHAPHALFDRRCSDLPLALLTTRRFEITEASPYSEDRVAHWCRRLWGLRQGGVVESGLVTSRPVSHMTSSFDDSRRGDKGQTGVLRSELHSQAKLTEELKSVMVGEKGSLPQSVVESVWDVYESIIPPEVPHDIARSITPAQETAFFAFIGLLTELDISLEELKSAAAKLTRGVAAIEAILANTSNASTSPSQEEGNQSPTQRGKREHAAKDAATISAELVAAKSALLRQCVEVRQAGSPVYYLWLRQTASLERGMRRLMDLRRCLTHFGARCRQNIEAQRPGNEKVSSRAQGSQEGEECEDDVYTMWVSRQRYVSSLDAALQFLFHDFFAKEWLVMEELTWFSTPPSLLEQVIAAEKVHPFHHGLEDLRQRLQPARHRHLFAFFHPAVVEAPLIAVQVALTKGIAGSVDHILRRPSPLTTAKTTLAESRHVAFTGHQNTNSTPSFTSSGTSTENGEDVDTAVFYSINSAQSALRGVNLGNLLIKRVVREIADNINAARRAAGRTPITTFTTLSPIPGFVPWLTMEAAKLRLNGSLAQFTLPCFSCQPGQGAEAVQTHRESEERRFFQPLREALRGYTGRHPTLLAEAHKADLCKDGWEGNMAALTLLLRLLETPHAGRKGSASWWEDPLFATALEGPLIRSVAHYLYTVKRRSRILDSVGNFHVSNGATMLRLNYLANCTTSGSRESGTVMVNYLYVPERIGDQVTAYEVHRTVCAGSELLQLLQV